MIYVFGGHGVGSGLRSTLYGASGGVSRRNSGGHASCEARGRAGRPERVEGKGGEVRSEGDAGPAEVEDDSLDECLARGLRQGAQAVKVGRGGVRRGLDLEADHPAGGILEDQVDFPPGVSAEVQERGREGGSGLRSTLYGAMTSPAPTSVARSERPRAATVTDFQDGDVVADPVLQARILGTGEGPDGVDRPANVRGLREDNVFVIGPGHEALATAAQRRSSTGRRESFQSK